MNAERLRGIIDFLLAAETATKIQDHLSALRGQIDALVGNPADQNNQRNTAAALSSLEKAVRTFVEGLTPSQRRDIAEVKARPYFSEVMVEEIGTAFAKNGMTPAVVQQQVHKLFDDRQRFLENLRNTQKNIEALGIKSDGLGPGEAEIGFAIPRDLFDNNLDEFQQELKTLNGIIRTFYEVSNLTPEPIEIREISTSDPVIFLEIAVAVLIFTGRPITWCIETIKGTWEVKKIADLARAAALDAPIIEGLEQQVSKKIEKCVEEKVSEILKAYTGDEHRKNELKAPLQKSLEQLLERVANGMTVEIRLLPPVVKEGDEAGAAKKAQFDELGQIAKSLDFPQIPPGKPMLQITRDEPEP
jgi:hypothetical protein